MRVLITGGAGFVGSHLCSKLATRGDTVTCVDDLSTGSMENITHLLDQPGFEFIQAHVTPGIEVSGPVDAVGHLASRASPQEYLSRPREALAAGSRGTENSLRLAHQHRARFLPASTSEIYGDPAVHPQPERYRGKVNPIGPRSIYDKAKRFAETLTFAYGRVFGMNVSIVRIFNTYGPRISASDGRIVPNFITQALNREPLTVYGNGIQIRSFHHVDDLVRGLILIIDSTVSPNILYGIRQLVSRPP
jgi:dTDP-glucose 4,6-dehydratase